eukprot:GHVT01016993.1.p1 GENE.GHVT01016993.1~~GHVT01016993.1.p1  ORF type:complete len:686 (+),score=82.71 GHVT01016993.1:300-2357(+)
MKACGVNRIPVPVWWGAAIMTMAVVMIFVFAPPSASYPGIAYKRCMDPAWVNNTSLVQYLDTSANFGTYNLTTNTCNPQNPLMNTRTWFFFQNAYLIYLFAIPLNGLGLMVIFTFQSTPTKQYIRFSLLVLLFAAQIIFSIVNSYWLLYQTIWIAFAYPENSESIGNRWWKFLDIYGYGWYSIHIHYPMCTGLFAALTLLFTRNFEERYRYFISVFLIATAWVPLDLLGSRNMYIEWNRLLGYMDGYPAGTFIILETILVIVFASGLLPAIKKAVFLVYKVIIWDVSMVLVKQSDKLTKSRRNPMAAVLAAADPMGKTKGDEAEATGEEGVSQQAEETPAEEKQQVDKGGAEAAQDETEAGSQHFHLKDVQRKSFFAAAIEDWSVGDYSDHFDRVVHYIHIYFDIVRFITFRALFLSFKSIALFLLLAMKDMSYGLWHFALRFQEEFILLLLEINHPDSGLSEPKWLFTLIDVLQSWVVRPFMLPKFLITIVVREIDVEEIIREIDDKREGRKFKRRITKSCADPSENTLTIPKVFSRQSSVGGAVAAAELPSGKSKQSRTSVIATQVAQVANVMRRKKKRNFIYTFADEMMLIKNIPTMAREKKESLKDVFSGTSSLSAHTVQSAWVSRVVEEIQYYIFCRAWPRLIIKAAYIWWFVILEVLYINNDSFRCSTRYLNVKCPSAI